MSESRDVVRFGVFELDLRAGELRKAGVRLSLQPQPFRVLAMLLERPDELVTREELKRQLWPDDTFVDFQHGLNAAVNRLRDTLGDSAEAPRLIETVPRRGYRFIGNIRNSDSGADAADATSLTSGAVGAALPPHGSLPSPGLAPRLWARFAPARQPALILAAVALMLAGAAWGAWSWFLPGSAAVTDSVRLTRSGRVMFPDRYIMQFPGLVTDGTQVYFSQGTAGASWGASLARVPLDGGATDTVRTPFRRQIVHGISADRSRLLVQEQPTALGLDTTEGPLWALPLAGQGPLRLGDVLAHDAAWSWSDRQLAFANAQELYVAEWDGSHPRKLATTGRAYWIRWAPDDSALRFTVSDRGNRTSLWEVRLDGTGLRRLLSDWRSDAQPCCGEWAPDGRHFVFVAFENGRSDIWIRRESKGRWRTLEAPIPVRLTSGPLSFASVIFSRDGRRLLAVNPDARATPTRFNLVTRAIEPSRIEGFCQRISPNRQWVLYKAPGSGSLWRSRLDGTEALQLTAPPLQIACDAKWSPDGRRVAFTGRMPGGLYKLHVVSSSGGAVRQLIPGNRQEIDVSWSPDGQAVMFGRPPDVLADPGMPKAIYVLDLKTGESTTLPGSEGMTSPHWFPDGQFVTASPQDTRDRLMRFDFATREWTVLVPYHASNALPSHDGKWAYFESEHGGSHMARVRLRDGHIERVVDYADVTRGTPMSCNNGGGVDVDGSPFLLCFVNTSELYALDLDLP